MTSDEQLMLEFQGGSREAFVELFERYREMIYAFFRRRLTDAARSEDLAQDTFVAVLDGVRRYEPRAPFRNYLCGIAFNLLAAERRKKACQHPHANEAQEPSATGDPDAALWVQSALEKLDADARDVLLLREYEQLSYAEIGALLRVPVTTVRSRLFRARLALKDRLVPQQGAS